MTRKRKSDLSETPDSEKVELVKEIKEVLPQRAVEAKLWHYSLS